MVVKSARALRGSRRTLRLLNRLLRRLERLPSRHLLLWSVSWRVVLWCRMRGLTLLNGLSTVDDCKYSNSC